MATKIKEYKPLKDEKGRFIPYCDCGWHQGLVKEFYYKICEERKCNHLRILRLGLIGILLGGINEDHNHERLSYPIYEQKGI